MRIVISSACSSLALCFLLSACGGSGEHPVVAHNPPPPPPPVTPTPTPGPPPPPDGPIGLVSDEPFAVLGVSSEYTTDDQGIPHKAEGERVDISFERRASDGSYVITLPDYRSGTLATVSYDGSYDDDSAWNILVGTTNQLLDGDTGRQDARVFLQWPSQTLNPYYTLTYTSFGTWGDDGDLDGAATSGSVGVFAYGIPTKSGDVPISGSATYTAQLIGSLDDAYEAVTGHPSSEPVIGDAHLDFDFAAGTLEGEMIPWACPWECYSLGTYTFVDTVYATGSTSFSGQFALDGKTVPSWFEGSFNGPGAAELMARWHAPYAMYGKEGTMTGIWIGKKD